MITFTPRIHHALELAARLHREQNRKDTLRTPYITHLVGVMLLLGEVTDEEDILIAGLMHDSLEDVKGYTDEKLTADCGGAVAEIVKGVTEIREDSVLEDRTLRWLTTKENYLKNLSAAGDKSVLVSVADKTHNLTTLINNYKLEGEEFLKHFSSMRNTLWFNDEVEKIVLGRLDNNNPLVIKFRAKLVEAHTVFKDYVV